MHIANPIYDVVFKYLMEDNDIAKLLIGTIIGEEIVALEFLPQESTVPIPQRSLTVYRLDFSATIKTPDGALKQVIIEIQKAKFATDIMRFRRYLGAQYQKKENVYEKIVEGKTIYMALPIVSMYFLGYPLEHTSAPVIKVARTYTDLTTGEPIREREEFIESLTHDSYVIQIPHLRPDHKTDVEQLLSIFDQHYVTSDSHILQINEADYPEKYREIIRRLQRAIAEPDVQRTMDAEDEIVEELQALERQIEHKEKVLEEKNKALAEQNKALAEQGKALAEQGKALAEQDRALKEKDRALADQERVIAEQKRLIDDLRKRFPVS